MATHFRVSLVEHGVMLADSKVRSLPQAIRWAESILTDKTERAFLCGFGNWLAVYHDKVWTKRSPAFLKEIMR